VASGMTEEEVNKFPTATRSGTTSGNQRL